MIRAFMNVAAAGLLLVLCIGCSNKPKDTIEVPLEGSALEGIELSDLSEAKIDVSKFKHKIVLINFWATWCKPCIQEMPTLAKAQEILREEDIIFLFASPENLDRIKKFKDNKSFPFQYVQVHNLEALHIQALPTTFIFDSNGALVFSEMGYRDWAKPENLEIITQKQ